MKSTGYILLLAMSITIAGSSCRINATKNDQAVESVSNAMPGMAGPPVIIYRTRANYDSLVPITLTPDHENVVAYPHPRDIYTGGELALPVHLVNGFLLDRRGIDSRVAFTKFTYNEYAALDYLPTPEQLLNAVVDADPLIEMFNCGSRYAFDDVVSELNQAILEGKFAEWERLK